jgi:hypothetical protein
MIKAKFTHILCIVLRESYDSPYFHFPAGYFPADHFSLDHFPESHFPESHLFPYHISPSHISPYHIYPKWELYDSPYFHIPVDLFPADHSPAVACQLSFLNYSCVDLGYPITFSILCRNNFCLFISKQLMFLLFFCI